MHSPQILKLLDAVVKVYGDFEYYGSSPEEEHGTCFKLNNIPATFSIHTQDGALEDTYDVQIEGIPPGDYLYTCETSLQGLIDTISKYESSKEGWP